MKIPSVFPAAALLLAASTAGAASYDVTTGFSLAGNPNGVWSYGYSTDLDLADFSANFTLMAQTSVENDFLIWRLDPSGPSVAVNTSSGSNYFVPPGMLTQHPGPGGVASMIRFTAPETATFDIVGEYLAGDGGVMALAVLVNGVATWTSSNSGAFDLDQALNLGDTVDFAVYGDYAYGNTPLSLTITSVPEPASYTAFAGLAILGFAAIRRRRA